MATNDVVGQRLNGARGAMPATSIAASRDIESRSINVAVIRIERSG